MDSFLALREETVFLLGGILMGMASNFETNFMLPKHLRSKVEDLLFGRQRY